MLVRFQLDLPQYFAAQHFGTAGYAIYAVGVFNLPLLGLLRESVGSIMLPRVSQLEYHQENQRIVQLMSRVSRKLALVYFPASRASLKDKPYYDEVIRDLVRNRKPSNPLR